MPRCGRCHNPLPERPTVKLLRILYPFRYLWPLVVLGSIIGGVTLIRGPTLADRQAQFSCTNPPMVATGLYRVYDFYDAQPRISPLTIRTSAGSNYFVKLEDVNHFPVMSFYIAGGLTIDEAVPIGTFGIKIAEGKNWCGEERLFGPDTQSTCLLAKNQTDNACQVYSFGDDGWSIELVPQVGGNLKRKHVPLNQF